MENDTTRTAQRLTEALGRFIEESDRDAKAAERDRLLDPMAARLAKRITDFFSLQMETLLGRMESKRDDLELTEAEALREHLMGHHDQRTHGRKGPVEYSEPREYSGEEGAWGVTEDPYDVYRLPDPEEIGWPQSARQGIHEVDGVSQRTIRRHVEEWGMRESEGEVALAYDKNGRLMVASYGEETAVDVPKMALAVTHTLVHNHPSTDLLQLSSGDAAVASTYRIRRMVMVSRSGTVVVEAPKGRMNVRMMWSKAALEAQAREVAWGQDRDKPFAQRVLDSDRAWAEGVRAAGFRVTQRRLKPIGQDVLGGVRRKGTLPPPFGEAALREAGVDRFSEHLMGQHDQSTHGKRGPVPAQTHGEYGGRGVDYDTYTTVQPDHDYFWDRERGDGPSMRTVRREAAKIRHEEREHAILWDDKGRKLVHVAGDESGVSEIPDRAGILTHTLLHNHPPGTESIGMSSTDAVYAAQIGARRMVVVGPGYTVSASVEHLSNTEAQRSWNGVGTDLARMTNPTFYGRPRMEPQHYEDAFKAVCRDNGVKVTVRHFEEAGVDRFLDEHLMGQHDQSTHGRKKFDRRSEPRWDPDLYVEENIGHWGPAGCEYDTFTRPLESNGTDVWGNHPAPGPSMRSVRREAEEYRTAELEHCTVWDGDGKKLVHAYGETASGVDPPERALMAAHTVLHNHPEAWGDFDTLGLSSGDCYTAHHFRIRRMVVVNGSGTVVAEVPPGADFGIWKQVADADYFGAMGAKAWVKMAREKGLKVTSRRFAQHREALRVDRFSEHGHHDQRTHGRRFGGRPPMTDPDTGKPYTRSDKPDPSMGTNVSWGGFYDTAGGRYVNLVGGEFRNLHREHGQFMNDRHARVRVYWATNEVYLYPKSSSHAPVSRAVAKKVASDVLDVEGGRFERRPGEDFPRVTVHIDGVRVAGARYRDKVDAYDLLAEAWRPGADNRITRIFDQVAFDTHTVLANILVEEKARARLLGQAQAYPEIGAGLSVNLPNPRATAEARRNAAELVTRINATTRKDLQRLVTEAVDSGESYSHLSRRIRDRYTEMGVKRPQEHIRDRATLIATTEMAFAYEQGNYEVGSYLTSQGVPMMKAWHAVGDEKMCVICGGNADAEWIAYDEEFPSGHLTAPAHPACRCAVIQRVYDPEDMTGAPKPEGWDTYMAGYDERAALSRAHIIRRAPDGKSTSTYQKWMRKKSPALVKTRLIDEPGVAKKLMQRDIEQLVDISRRYPVESIKRVVYTNDLPPSELSRYEHGTLYLNARASQPPLSDYLDDAFKHAYEEGWTSRLMTRADMVTMPYTEAWHEEMLKKNPTLKLTVEQSEVLQTIRDKIVETNPAKWDTLPMEVADYQDLTDLGEEAVETAVDAATLLTYLGVDPEWLEGVYKGHTGLIFQAMTNELGPLSHRVGAAVWTYVDILPGILQQAARVVRRGR